jgi:hypothetical protein
MIFGKIIGGKTGKSGAISPQILAKVTILPHPYILKPWPNSLDWSKQWPGWSVAEATAGRTEEEL